MTTEERIDGLLDDLEAIYETSVANLHADLAAYAGDGSRPDEAARAEGRFAYPELRIVHDPKGDVAVPGRAFARLNIPGTYSTSVARPKLFRPYLREQLSHIMRDYDVTVTVGRSHSEIPYPFVLDQADLDLDGLSSAELSRWFPSTELEAIGDEVADGVWDFSLHPTRPLALFDGPRTDFSLARLKHYSGTSPWHFQRYVLFTNYVRYVDEFVRLAIDELRKPDSRFTAFSVPGGYYERGQLADAEAQIAAGTWRRHQMPAYHLIAEDNEGITLVNIGVGPSNAKTICDHVAVLRPEAWLMIGHCGGLRPSQTIGDYVLAHAYLRDDHVLDEMLPVEIPIPAIAEVQTAMYRAALDVTGESEEQLKKRLRTGTVVTTDDRNWELRYTLSAKRFNQSRAVGIDMESATVAAQGYRFRVPYGTLLCVSDKPLHGELKLPGQANAFYEKAISQHLRIGIEALDQLRHEGDGLHSRKLRSFDEPPLR
ncbi:AMP nucleosidase [Sphingomicrobium astaxanthinifaciens]|uniref:AMP nucleosidase n=1 Tax=Sphingomicrobium astaxanthinifaciens TaxID=1227949 RepID=UPI001FCB613D|nr:AMP nucleosidase [Sphingomicrobium astaxanthinifaciens]MCJ7420473.1 AMP nucleosidase [Sphingomicrobium astaxanthinifaciens]